MTLQSFPFLKHGKTLQSFVVKLDCIWRKWKREIKVSTVKFWGTILGLIMKFCGVIEIPSSISLNILRIFILTFL
uniref:Uncharacterized protein n=1 Tax=Arundo donax TaxID=35708 RepID=A0A0A9DMH0_ARUDO